MFQLPAIVLKENTPDHVCAAIAAILNRQTSCHAQMTFLDHVVGLARYMMHLARIEACVWTDFSIQKIQQRMQNEVGGTSLVAEKIAKTWGLVLHIISIWDDKCLLGKEATYLSAYGPVTGLAEMMVFQELDAEGRTRLAEMWCRQAGVRDELDVAALRRNEKSSTIFKVSTMYACKFMLNRKGQIQKGRMPRDVDGLHHRVLVLFKIRATIAYWVLKGSADGFGAAWEAIQKLKPELLQPRVSKDDPVSVYGKLAAICEPTNVMSESFVFNSQNPNNVRALASRLGSTPLSSVTQQITVAMPEDVLAKLREEGLMQRNRKKKWVQNEVQATMSRSFSMILCDQASDVVLQAGEERWSQLVQLLAEGRKAECCALIEIIMTGENASQGEWGRVWEVLVALLRTPCPDEAEWSTVFDSSDRRPKLFSNVWPVKGFASETYDARYTRRYTLDKNGTEESESKKEKEKGALAVSPHDLMCIGGKWLDLSMCNECGQHAVTHYCAMHRVPTCTNCLHYSFPACRAMGAVWLVTENADESEAHLRRLLAWQDRAFGARGLLLTRQQRKSIALAATLLSLSVAPAPGAFALCTCKSTGTTRSTSTHTH